MTFGPITQDHLTTLRWKELTASELERMAFGGKQSDDSSWWRIDADLTCFHCGALQGVDSDPTKDQTVAVELALRLFNGAGWRADLENRTICPDCQSLAAGPLGQRPA